MLICEPDTINTPTFSSECPLLGCRAHCNQWICRTCCLPCQRLGKSMFTSSNSYFSPTLAHFSYSFLWLITPRLLGGRYAGRHYYPKDSLNLLHLASGFGPEHIEVKANTARGGEEQLWGSRLKATLQNLVHAPVLESHIEGSSSEFLSYLNRKRKNIRKQSKTQTNSKQNTQAEKGKPTRRVSSFQKLTLQMQRCSQPRCWICALEIPSRSAGFTPKLRKSQTQA